MSDSAKSDRKKGIIPFIIVFDVISLFLILSFLLVVWYSDNFGESISMLIFTLKHSEGANLDIVKEAFFYCLPGVLVWIMLIAIVELAIKNLKNTRIICAGLLVFLFVGCIADEIYADHRMNLKGYIQSRFTETDLYENYYVFPDISSITSDNPRNLIYIYMESMETSYASMDKGGRQRQNNYIPNLTDIAFNNVSFSNSDALGGFYQVNGTGWTAAATFASMTGVPYTAPTTDISAGYKALVSIGDILKSKGYYLEYICGSDADFSGRRTFFQKHGDIDIMDYQAAIDAGYIAPDHFVWWGYEDEVLYSIAKNEISKAAGNMDMPFDITLLTVDTHYTDGYVCELCEDQYDDQYSNVICCADSQVSQFLEWCSEQPWYEDTVIIIQGDHPYMRKTPILSGIPSKDRTTYNCFINTVHDTEPVRETNRVFTCMDMYPTTLSAIGFEIPGDRLGLGTDLFSDTPTIAEELGLSRLDTELNRHSRWYLDHIASVGE